MAEARKHVDRVLLDLLPRRTAVPRLTTREIGVDRGAIEEQAGGQPREDRGEGRAVRFAGG